MRKLVCSEPGCRWCGDDTQALKASDPFNPGEELWACPECRTADSLVFACEADGCTERGSCGQPTEGGYRWTCFEHRQV